MFVKHAALIVFLAVAAGLTNAQVVRTITFCTIQSVFPPVLLLLLANLRAALIALLIVPLASIRQPFAYPALAISF